MALKFGVHQDTNELVVVDGTRDGAPIDRLLNKWARTVVAEREGLLADHESLLPTTKGDPTYVWKGLDRDGKRIGKRMPPDLFEDVNNLAALMQRHYEPQLADQKLKLAQRRHVVLRHEQAAQPPPSRPATTPRTPGNGWPAHQQPPVRPGDRLQPTDQWDRSEQTPTAATATPAAAQQPVTPPTPGPVAAAPQQATATPAPAPAGSPEAMMQAAAAQLQAAQATLRAAEAVKQSSPSSGKPWGFWRITRWGVGLSVLAQVLNSCFGTSAFAATKAEVPEFNPDKAVVEAGDVAASLGGGPLVIEDRSGEIGSIPKTQIPENPAPNAPAQRGIAPVGL